VKSKLNLAIARGIVFCDNKIQKDSFHIYSPNMYDVIRRATEVFEHMKNHLFGVVSTLGFLLVGCSTVKTPESPYEYVAAEGDRQSVTDPYVRTERVNRLKVAVRPAKKAAGVRNIDEQVCTKIKEKLSGSDFFEIAVRDDLANIEKEIELWGKDAGDSVVPSELLVIVNANIDSYLGGVSPDRIEQLKKMREIAYSNNDMTAFGIIDKQIKNAQLKPVDDPGEAYGVGVRATCSAYDCSSKRQYATLATSENKYGSVKGRVDSVIENASAEIARKFVSRLSSRVAPAMKTDSVIIETRGNGAVAKVDVSDLQRRFVVGECAKVYTHVKGRKGVDRREIAEGIVWAIEDGFVWIRVEKNLWLW